MSYNDQVHQEVPVSIRMFDGSTVCGKIRGGLVADLGKALNKDASFLEFLSANGQKKYLAKSQIAYVEPMEPLKAPRLQPRFNDSANPYLLLGIPEGSNFDTAKAAYRDLAKKYHPDRFSGLDLPDEISRYAAEMFRQINNALTHIRGYSETERDANAA